MTDKKLADELSKVQGRGATGGLLDTLPNVPDVDPVKPAEEPTVAEGDVLDPGELHDARALVPASATDISRPYSLGEYRWMAAAIAGAVTVPKALHDARDVLAVMLAGRELGIGPMESTRMIDVINGSTALRAKLKLKLARRAGHDIHPVEWTATSARVVCASCASHEVLWGPEDTKAAGLADKDVWKKFGRHMCFWRAVSLLIDSHCPEVVAGFATTEELE